MSVAQLSAQELGTFAAIIHKLDLLPYDKLAPLCQAISQANCNAWRQRYSDTIEPIDGDELEKELLAALANEEARTSQWFGPLAYNIIDEGGATSRFLEIVRELEKRAQKWQEGRQRDIERAEENAIAFDGVGQLPVISGEEITARCQGLGCKRVILATYRVCESDTQTDYYGGRSVRTVVIGYGKGVRENFKQLRKAAAAFPPTTYLGPGHDIWRVWVNREPPKENGYTNSTREGDVFDCEEDAQKWIDGETLSPESTAGICAAEYGYRLRRESIENRENYSMGGGNYLGWDRYGGWQVWSTRLDYFGGDHEVYEASEVSTPARPETKPEPVASTWCEWVGWL